jgi:hypothetical protein
MVADQCRLLKASVVEYKDNVATELRRSHGDNQPSQILGAWLYALDTMLEEAKTSKTCAWIVEGTEDVVLEDSDGGDITLRRV